MPFVFIIVGTVLLVTSVRNTYGQTTPSGGPGLGALIQSDFTGSANFVYWLIAMLLIGAVGYIPKLRPLSVAFLTLVIIVLFLKEGNPSTGQGGGFFSQFTNAIKTTQTSTGQTASTGTPTSTGTLGSTIPSLGNLIPSIPMIGGL